MSVALLTLREKYDEVHKKCCEKERDLDLLKKEIDKASAEERTVSRDVGSGTANEDQAREKLAHIHLTHDFQNLYRRTYMHM